MVVLDSSFFVAWYNRRDVHHRPARDLMERFLEGEWGSGLLLEYVFLEVVTVLLARRGREAAFEASRRLLEARELELVAGADLFLDAVDTFRAQRGRQLSFTDAALVTLATTLETPRIVTFDDDFRELDGLDVIP